MRRIINTIIAGAWGVLMLCVGCFYGADVAETENEPVVVTEVQKVVEVQKVEVPVYKTVTVTKTADRPVETVLNQAEKELIASVVYAEAKYEDMIGKRLVVDVVLNRRDNERFPNTVYGVVYQKGQMHYAALWNDECMKAVEAELYERLDYDIYWFNNDGYLPYGTEAYKHGNHYFCWEEL